MSIATEITRLQGAKADIKAAIENNLGQTVPSSVKLNDFPLYIQYRGIYSSAPTANGIYIKYTDGTYSDWNVLVSEKTALGIAIKSDASSFCILSVSTSPKNGKGWSSNSSYEYLVPDVFTTTDSSVVLSDYNGRYNTDKVVSYYTNLAQLNRVPIFNSTTNIDDTHPANAYVPSVGELMLIAVNVKTIEYVAYKCFNLNRMFASEMANPNFVSSDQYDTNTAWAVNMRTASPVAVAKTYSTYGAVVYPF